MVSDVRGTWQQARQTNLISERQSSPCSWLDLALAFNHNMPLFIKLLAPFTRNAIYVAQKFPVSFADVKPRSNLSLALRNGLRDIYPVVWVGCILALWPCTCDILHIHASKPHTQRRSLGLSWSARSRLQESLGDCRRPE